jgi:siroheme synthase (precorrin-2 oxidase/ferrochelatase)
MNTEYKFHNFLENVQEMFTENHVMFESGDKTNFCGNMHPELMSICQLILAIETGSTVTSMAAALMRCNTKR